MAGLAPEAFIPLNGSAGNSASVSGATGATGGRRHKLTLVTRKQARKLLKKMGKKMRGGTNGDGSSGDGQPGAIVVGDPNKNKGGRRYRGTKKTRRHGKRHSRNLFGLRY